jgi:putative transposase
VKGRKRHLLVDTQGFILKAKVLPANITDREGGQVLLTDIHYQFPCICHLWVDIGYRGRFVQWVKDTLFWTVEVSRHWWQGIRGVWVGPGQEAPTYPAGFQVLRWRWIVERTLAWLNFNRRLSKDFELLPETTETWMYLSMSRLMLRRLAKTNT